VAKRNGTDPTTLESLDDRESIEIQDLQVTDEASTDDVVALQSYDISCYGADYDVEGLVKRLVRSDILIPSFQRDYVWNKVEASRFIESLLLGLPVPGIFLAREQDTNKLLVIDGQQRLKTLQFFYNGYFNPRNGDRTRQVFTLTKVQPKFDGLTYQDLEATDRIRLNDSIIHATIVKQEAPSGDDTSIYYIFERINYGGRRLTPQEIRVAIYHGRLMELIKDLNQVDAWRKLYGKLSPRLKDQELILRFLAFFVSSEEYARPMNEFINKFTAKHRNDKTSTLDQWGALFKDCISLVSDNIGKSAFRPETTINAAVFDSVMVGLGVRLAHGPIKDKSGLKKSYSDLLANTRYQAIVSRSTADEKFVAERIDMATKAFARLK